MAKFLLIAEKPSVAQSLAKNLSAYQREDGYLEGNSCIVSWCLGHLAEYAPPEIYDEKYAKWQFDDLPIIPEVWKVQVSEDKKNQFEVLCSLMNRGDVAYLVNGCDAGREGELIFKRVYDLAGCQKPVKRLWISSMEDEAIQKGFQTLKDGKEYAGLCNAAVCRAQADWLIGMNATRAYTTRYFKRLVVGRVQTPTLAMLTERKEKIEQFKKEAYYKVSLSDGKLTVTSENIQSETDADELRKLCDGTEAMVTKVKKAQKRISPPKLYDLTSLQREAKMFTEDTLLAAMETAGNKEFDSDTEKKGLGTPATRANIIEKLVSSGYAERKGKQIIPTVAGCELIHVMPENLKSASLTAEWENQLLMMEKGKIQDDEFMDGIVSMITEILSVCRAIPEEERNRFQTAREVIGKCPVCGSDVYEGKSNYYCSDRSCPFALWKSNRFLESMKKSMDKKMAVELLKKGRTHVKGLYSKKKDSKFDADLVLGVEDGKARFSLEFPKKKTNSNKKKK